MMRTLFTYRLDNTLRDELFKNIYQKRDFQRGFRLQLLEPKIPFQFSTVFVTKK